MSDTETADLGALYDAHIRLYYAFRAIPESKIRAKREAREAWSLAYHRMRAAGGTPTAITALLRERAERGRKIRRGR